MKSALLGWALGQFANTNELIEARSGAMDVRVKAIESWKEDTSTTVAGLENKIDDAVQVAARSSAAAQQYLDANPCEPYGFQVNVVNNQRIATFTTTGKCTAWLQGGYNYGKTAPDLRATRGSCLTTGTVPINYDGSAIASSFTYAIPASWPEHGCMIVNTWDEGSNKKSKTFIY